MTLQLLVSDQMEAVGRLFLNREKVQFKRPELLVLMIMIRLFVLIKSGLKFSGFGVWNDNDNLKVAMDSRVSSCWVNNDKCIFLSLIDTETNYLSSIEWGSTLKIYF